MPRGWDTATGTLVAELRGQSNTITALQFSPDGRTLATGAGDWTVALWHMDVADGVRRLCAVAVPAARADGEEPPAPCRES